MHRHTTRAVGDGAEQPPVSSAPSRVVAAKKTSPRPPSPGPAADMPPRGYPPPVPNSASTVPSASASTVTVSVRATPWRATFRVVTSSTTVDENRRTTGIFLFIWSKGIDGTTSEVT